MSKTTDQLGKKYADVIANNPGKGKRVTKIRHNACVEYKKALSDYLKTLKKVVKNQG